MNIDRLIYKPNSKREVEDCFKISICKLSKIFVDDLRGVIYWAGSIYRVSFSVDLKDNSKNISLVYTTANDKNEPVQIKQQFLITSTFCNYGGVRFWFTCKCSRRAGTLYKPIFGNYFACRHCHNLTYNSRNQGGFNKRMGKVINIHKLEHFKSRLRKKVYKGKLTKKYRKYLDRLYKFKQYFIAFEVYFNNRFFKKKGKA